MSLQIRNYNPDDCQAILDIINFNILHSTALYDYAPRKLENQLAIFEEKLMKGFPVIVAEKDQKVVGFGYYSEFRFREAYRFTIEHSVYVHQDYQGQSIGKRILEHLIILAQEQKLHTMIGVIDSENKGSIFFHEKMGFKTVGIIKETGYKFDRWLDSVFMQLLL